MARNLGIRYDFDKYHGGNGKPKSNGYPSGECENNKSIMSFGSARTTWSLCSSDDFDTYWWHIKRTGFWCMDSKLGLIS